MAKQRIRAEDYQDDYYSKNEFFEKTNIILNYILENNECEYRHIADKYKDYINLPDVPGVITREDTINELIKEAGYEKLANVVNLSTDNKAILYTYLKIFDAFRGNRYGLDLIFKLLGFENEDVLIDPDIFPKTFKITEWWQKSPQGARHTWDLFIKTPAEDFDDELIDKLLEFFPTYVFPLVILTLIIDFDFVESGLLFHSYYDMLLDSSEVGNGLSMFHSYYDHLLESDILLVSGEKIYFQRDNEIFIMDPDGSNQLQISNMAGLGATSVVLGCLHPDYNQVFLASNHETGTNRQLYVFSINTITKQLEMPKRLTNDSFTYGVCSINTAKNKLIFDTNQGSSANAIGGANYNDIARTLGTISLIIDRGASNRQSGVSGQAFKPNSDRFCFYSDGLVSQFQWEIRAINFDGTGETLLAGNPSADTGFSVSWNPVLDLVTWHVSLLSGTNNISVMSSIDGTGKAVVADDASLFENNPNFSPDGQFIVYKSPVDGNEELFKVSRLGGTITQLTSTTGVQNKFPLWGFII